MMRAASRRDTLAVARPVSRRLSATTLLGAAAAGCGIGLLATSAWLISRASEQPSVVALGLAIVGVRFFAIARGLFRYAERLVGHDAAFRELADVRARTYEHLERLAPSGLGAFRSGDLLARLVGDVDSFQDLMLRVIPPYGAAIVVGIGTVALMWWLLPAAGVILAVTLVLAVGPVPRLTQVLARRSESGQAAARGALGASVVDLLDGAPDLVAYGATDAQLARIGASDTELTRVAAAAARTAGVGSGLTTLLTGLAVCGAVLVGVPAVRAGRLDSVLLAVVVLTPLAAFELAGGLPAAAQTFEHVRHAAARVFAVLATAPPVTEPPAPASLPHAPYTLRLRDVAARYSAAAPWTLAGIDLDLAPARRVAIVGASGAGKSTLAAVLARFVPYERGSIELSGTELSGLDGDDVRRVIGLVTHDAHIFDTTLRENLLLARRTATEHELREALARARLLDWVDQLPLGLDTDVGQHGARLSGGQRQRLSIARALLADFPILVLDEPGSHLDAATADELEDDLLAAVAGRATVLITHRLRGLDAVDEIVVLDAGEVVERGTHAVLIAGGGLYAQWWRHEKVVGGPQTEGRGAAGLDPQLAVRRSRVGSGPEDVQPQAPVRRERVGR